MSQPRRRRSRASVGQQHHCQREMNPAAKESYRWRRHAPSTPVAAKAETRTEIVEHLAQATARLARKVSLMKNAAAWAALESGLFGQIAVDLDQLLKELDIVNEGVAHCGQSKVVRNRRLPQKDRLFKILAGVTPTPIALRDQYGVKTHQVE